MPPPKLRLFLPDWSKHTRELTGLFAMIDDIHIEFATSQIITEDRTAMVRTIRRASAPGFVDAYVDFSFVLQKQGKIWRIAQPTS